MDNINFLKIPLYKLNYIKNVNDFSGFDADDIASFKNEYSSDEIKSIIDSLEWGCRNPNYDFSSLLPRLGHSNSDIYKYVCKAYQSLKPLANDDRIEQTP